MMCKGIGIAMCSCMVISWNLTSLQAAERDAKMAATPPAQKRVAKILVGPSEPARVQLLRQLHVHRGQFNANLDVIIDATRQLLAEHADGVSDNAHSHPRIATAPVPESLSLLLKMLAKSPHADAHAVVVEALDHPDPHVSMVAMDAVGEFQITAAVDDLAMQIKRPAFEDQYAFRFALVRALACLHCPQCIEWLERLSEHVSGQLQHEITTRLANVDLRDFEGDRLRLANYKEQHPDDTFLGQAGNVLKPMTPVKPASAITRNVGGKLQLQDAPSESQGKLRLVKSQYYGIDLVAGRMLFIIDRSGSMREPAYHETRLESAKRELIRALNELTPETEFAIMLFDTEVESWRSELLAATEENKLKAIAFVKRITWGDRTNTHGVLSEALQFDDQLEAVFLLTDGRPTAGNILVPQGIISDIVGRNRMRHLKINTIGIGVNAVTSDFLKTLANETGGEYRRVD